MHTGWFCDLKSIVTSNSSLFSSALNHWQAKLTSAKCSTKMRTVTSSRRYWMECVSCEINITAPSRLYNMLAVVVFVFWLTFSFGPVFLSFVAVLLKPPWMCRVGACSRSRFFLQNPKTIGEINYAPNVTRRNGWKEWIVVTSLPPLMTQKVIIIHILQSLVYDILHSSTAITDYSTGLGKLSANGQILVGDQITVYL